MAAVGSFFQEQDFAHGLVRLGGDAGHVSPRDGGEDGGEGGCGDFVVSRHVPRREHVAPRLDAGEVRMAGVDSRGQLGRASEEGGYQVRRRVVDRVRDAGSPDHVVADRSRGGGLEVLLDLGLRLGIEVGDGRVFRVTNHAGGSRDGFVESVRAVGEELHEVGGLNGACRGPGDAGRFLVERLSVRRTDPDAKAEVGETRRRRRSRSRRRFAAPRQPGKGPERRHNRRPIVLRRPERPEG